MAHDVFVSYAAVNKTAADASVAALEQEGIRCWIAPRDVVPGRNYMASISEAIREAKVMVLVFSTAANDSNHVGREVQQATERGIPILPLRIDEAQPGDSLSYALVGTHWLDAMSAPLEAHLKRLTAATQTLLDREVTVRPSSAPPSAPPQAAPPAERAAPKPTPAPASHPSAPPPPPFPPQVYAQAPQARPAYAPPPAVGSDSSVYVAKPPRPHPGMVAWLLWPILSCGMLGAVPFVWAAVQKPVKKWIIPAVAVGAVALTTFVLVAMSPSTTATSSSTSTSTATSDSSTDSTVSDTSTAPEAELSGTATFFMVLMFLGVPIAGAVYGAIWRKEWQAEHVQQPGTG